MVGQNELNGQQVSSENVVAKSFEEENRDECEISLCFGSSCFARGNEKNLELIENYLRDRHLSAKVDLSGTRCKGKCLSGPNLCIDGVFYEKVDVHQLRQILDRRFGYDSCSSNEIGSEMTSESKGE